MKPARWPELYRLVHESELVTNDSGVLAQYRCPAMVRCEREWQLEP